MTNREMENWGIPRSSFETAERLNKLPAEAYEFVATMSSHLLAQDLAQAYITTRSHRVMTANIFRELGIKGEELGFVMKSLHEMAVGNAQPRRRRINQRSV